MADFAHLYLAAEDMALTEPQRAAIVDAFKALGPTRQESDWPPHINHWRVSNDGSKVIFEARFNKANLTAERVIQYLADAVGVSTSVIDDTLTQTARGPLLTLSAGGTQRFRMLLFGGIDATWEESRQQALVYLAANRAEWEAELE